MPLTRHLSAKAKTTAGKIGLDLRIPWGPGGAGARYMETAGTTVAPMLTGELFFSSPVILHFNQGLSNFALGPSGFKRILNFCWSPLYLEGTG